MSSFLCDARCFVFSLLCVFGLALPPCGLCHLSFSCWFSPFVSPPPATMVAYGRVLTLVSLVFAPVFSFNSPFFVSPPPPHWRYAAGFDGWFAFLVSAFPSITFFAFQKCGVGFEKPQL